MLHGVKDVFGFAMGATNGDIGEVTDVYFDDRRWILRYMVVATGRWLHGRKVLISPLSVSGISWDDGVIGLTITQQQVRASPGIDTDKPVSRQHEIAFCNHYGYPSYWEGPSPWSVGIYPLPWVGASPDAVPSLPPPAEGLARRQPFDCEHPAGDCHLRSSKQVTGYEVMATDGPVGTVADFVFDDGDWAIRHALVTIRRWLYGRQVLLPAESIVGVSSSEHEVHLDLTREAVEALPEYDRGLGELIDQQAAPDGGRARHAPHPSATERT